MLLEARMPGAATDPIPQRTRSRDTGGRIRWSSLAGAVLLHVWILLLLLWVPSSPRTAPASQTAAIEVQWVSPGNARGPEESVAAATGAATRPSPSVPQKPRPRVKPKIAPPPAPAAPPSTPPNPEAHPAAAPAEAAPATSAAATGEQAEAAFAGSGAAATVDSDGPPPDCRPIPYGWLNRVAQTISAHQRYPAMSRQLGEQGTVYLRLSMDRNGLLLETPLLRSSGYRRLDEEAQDLMRRIRSFGRVPDSACPQHRVIVIDQPIRFAGP
jgi:protein TonB